MNEDKVKQIAIIIAQALQLKDVKQVQQVLTSMSDEGIQAVSEVVDSNDDDETKIQSVKRIVQADLQKNQATLARYGAKLNYIKRLSNL